MFGFATISPARGADMTAAVLASPCCTGIDTLECGVVYVVARNDIAGDGTAASAVLTADGRGYDTSGWHDGPEADSVYVERWTAEGRAFHGWIDSATRQLVQAG